MQLDHRIWVRRDNVGRAYRFNFVADLRAWAALGEKGALEIEHDADGSCCAIEPWSESVARLQDTMGLPGEPARWMAPNRWKLWLQARLFDLEDFRDLITGRF